MSNLHSLLNPLSSGPPTPVCLVGTHPPSATVPDLSLDGAAQNEVEEVVDSDATESEPEIEQRRGCANGEYRQSSSGKDAEGLMPMEVEGVREEEEDDDNRTVTDPGMESEVEMMLSREDEAVPEPAPIRDDTVERREVEVNGREKDLDLGVDANETHPREPTRSPSPVRSGDGEQRSPNAPRNGVVQLEGHSGHQQDTPTSRTHSPSPFNPVLLHQDDADTSASTTLPFSPTPSTPPEITTGMAAANHLAPQASRKEKAKKPKSSSTSAAPKKKGVAKTVTKKKKPTVVTVSISDDENAPTIDDVLSRNGTPPVTTILTGSTGKKAPAVKKKRKRETKNGDNPLYCICRKPDTGKWMIQCEACEEWYHGDCVKVREEDEKLIDKYFCISCHDPPNSVTTWKRKCRLPSCREPASIDPTTTPPKLSKYCTPTHGIEFFNLQLSRSTLPRSTLATLISATPSLHAFKSLGLRIPTPPPESPSSPPLPFTPEELTTLSDIAQERQLLDAKRRNLDAKHRYLTFALSRKKRVFEELKAAGESVGKDICGYDERFAMDDDVWEAWVEEHLGDEVDDDGEEHVRDVELRKGKEGVCMKKRCVRHARWGELVGEDIKAEEVLRRRRLEELGEEEKRVRERRKRLCVKDLREGVVEVEGAAAV
ncbi:hypothetical protein EX30DRAFT_392657 [Ascodesmis nigricans]|uniref:Zinc finger PHD-type domain-containing protein n=1 Tax=Ascodesmis nigricans TaxID=341454 RepID=A0A4S2N7G9_9PEZI|nr:hypothetical protein EX30DRAFT_392657 [Ascodesmis nigricans]